MQVPTTELPQIDLSSNISLGCSEVLYDAPLASLSSTSSVTTSTIFVIPKTIPTGRNDPFFDISNAEDSGKIPVHSKICTNNTNQLIYGRVHLKSLQDEDLESHYVL